MSGTTQRKPLTREFYEGLKAEAEKFGGVGSNRVKENHSDRPVCLWGLAIHAQLTDMSPYASGGWKHCDWQDFGTQPYDEESAPLPHFTAIDEAVHQLRQKLGLERYDSDDPDSRSRVPLDALLAELGIEVLP